MDIDEADDDDRQRSYRVVDPRETDRRLYEAELEHERDRRRVGRRKFWGFWGNSPQERGFNFGTFLLLVIVLGPLLYAILKGIT